MKIVIVKAVASFLALVLPLVLAGIVPVVAAAAEPVPSPRPIFFARGSTSGTIGGHVMRGQHKLYSFKAGAGHMLTVTLTAPDDNVVFEIYAPGTAIGRGAGGALEFKGEPLRGETEDTTRWHGRLPRDGTYLLAVASTRGNARYSVDVKVE